MREILFRGKRLDNGEWVEGDLLRYGASETNIHYYAQGVRRAAWVDPSTVGQYTGLTDTNGKRVFEGDIITHEKAKGVVRFGQYESKAGGNEIGFYIAWHDRVYAGWYRNDIGYWICDVENKAVVSGNIHDNPELLGGADNG